MDITLIIYILFSLPILYHDIKYQDIPDKYSLSAIVLTLFSLYFFNHDMTTSLIAAGFIFVVFLIPIVFNMNFGGGDIRYGILSALIVGFPQVAYWLILAATLHLFLLLVIRKQIFGFAPAMFIATILLPFLYPYIQ